MGTFACQESRSHDCRVFHKAILADLLTPVSAFIKIGGKADRAFLLESVEGGEKIGRYSFIGVHPDRHFEGTFADFRQSFPTPTTAPDGLPPFTGGAVGVFSYDMVREFEHIPKRIPSRDEAHVTVDFYSSILAFDHLKHQIVIMSHQGREQVEELENLLQTASPLISAGRQFSDHHLRHETEPTQLAVEASNFSEEDFCAAVEKAKQYILRGDIFQVVLSQRFEALAQCSDFNFYRALRFVNPSPYLFFLKMGETSVVGSSPEMLLRVQGNQLDYRPIAGTRQRGRDAEHEKLLEQELLEDEKERAEHLMLVDLGRNDLGRVSEWGSVKVEDFMTIEKYSHVIHLVSSLKGRLRPELSRFDALAACFPAGTVTGAPKVRAMEIIEELERSRRGIYAGAVGYLDFSGNLDTCIAIRTVELSDGKIRLQAGAGIVADSIPENEFRECHNKAKALFHALELAQELEDH
jgi:anthranilate synthase component 1